MQGSFYGEDGIWAARRRANLGAKAPFAHGAMRPEAEASGYLIVLGDCTSAMIRELLWGVPG
jgi:hypothetical protein